MSIQALDITYAAAVGAGWTVTDIGSDASATSASKTVTCTNGVPAGSLIVVIVGSTSTSLTPSITDSGNNTWVMKNSTGAHEGYLMYTYNCNAIPSGGTIVVSMGAADLYGMSAFYTPSALRTSDPYDSAVFKVTQGVNGNISLVSGTPAVSNELFVGAHIFHGAVATWSEGASWAAPPDAVRNASNPGSFGGNRVNAGTGTLTYNPTQNAASSWEAMIAGFKHA